MNADNVLAEQFEAHRRHLRAVADRVLGSVEEAQDAVLAGGCGSAARTPRRSRTWAAADDRGRARVPGRASLGIGATSGRPGLPRLSAGLCRVGSSHTDSEALRADSVGVAQRVVPPGSREPSRRDVEVELVADPQRRSGLDLVMSQR